MRARGLSGRSWLQILLDSFSAESKGSKGRNEETLNSFDLIFFAWKEFFFVPVSDWVIPFSLLDKRVDAQGPTWYEIVITV